MGSISCETTNSYRASIHCTVWWLRERVWEIFHPRIIMIRCRRQLQRFAEPFKCHTETNESAFIEFRSHWMKALKCDIEDCIGEDGLYFNIVNNFAQS